MMEHMRNIERRERDAERREATERIAELEQQLAAAHAELAALREPVAGLRLTPSSVEADLESFEEDADQYREGTLGEREVHYAADWLAMYRTTAQQREQLASRDARCAELEREVERAAGVIADFIRSKRDAWVRTADRLPTEADANADGDVIWWSVYNGLVPGNWKSKAAWRTHWRMMPAPPADDEGGDDEQS